MDQEKTVHFSVIKQKIIKTDEVLKMYIDMSNKFKKAQQACKEIKLQLDQTVTNFSRIQLEHERCNFNIENLKQRNNILDKENRELCEQKLLLEEQYNQQSVQSQLSIKCLQDELQIIRDLKHAADNWSPKKKRIAINSSEKKFENDIKNNHLKMNEHLTTDVDNGSHPDTDSNLQMCSGLLKEKKLSKSQVQNANRYSSVSSQTPGKPIREEDLKIIINDSESDKKFKKPGFVEQKKHKLIQDIGVQTHKSEIKRRSIHIQTVETCKTLQLRDEIFLENKQLKQRILNYDEEIIKLRVTESMKKSCYTQTEEMEIEDELVEDILKEMSIPRVLSPLSPSMNENLNVEDTFSSIAKNMSNSFSAVPKIVVIPPTPMKKAIETDFTFDEKQIFNQNVDVVTDYSNLIKSPLRHDKIYTENAKFSRRYKYRPPIIRNDFVKLKQNYLRRLAKKKHILNKEIMKIRNLRRQDNLLKTLCTLKHLKINFTISSDSALVKNDDRDFKYIGNHNNVRKENVLVKKSETYSTEQLNCDCKKCNQSNMLLSNSNGEIHLLGFYSIKSEINTPVGSRMENVSDTKSFDTLKLINSSLNLNNSTPESVLEMLAEMVSKKLNDRKRNVSRRNTISNQSDTFCSETETEIERLFYKSNHDVLERNKMLLETAKKQKQMLNLPATEKYQHFSEGKNCLSFDSNNGLNTGIVNFEEGSEYSVHAEDSLCTNDSIRIENESCFDLPSCPQLLSPINSVKNLEIPKRHVNTSSCENGGTSLATSVEKLSNFVKNKSNDSGCSELHEDESGGRYQENKELQQNCIVHTNKICLDDNLTISSNVYEDDGTNFLSNCCTDMSLHGDKSEETGNIQCRSENFLQLPKTDETINENITEKTNTLLDDNDIKQLSCLVRTNFTENQDDSIGAPTDERSEFESIPNFPDSPVPEDVNVEVKWPIVIPLEKLDKQENTENCRINEQINTFSTEVPNNENFTTAPKKIVRRSKRISEKKRCSELSNSNSNLNESLIKNSENFVDLSSSIHPILDHNLLTKSESQEISKTASENIVSLVEEQVEGFSTIHISKCVDECKETTVATSNTRKRMSKLKSQVLRQIRVKRQMFKTHTNCHVSETDNKSTVKDGKLVTQSNKDIKKICIVQNILIPANSDHAVDLLKTGEREDFEIKEKCDISLGSIQNSSRNNTTVLNIPPNKKKANSNDCNIPNKKKRVGRAKMDCDILSKIIDEMDKDRPEIITKEKKQPLDSKEKVPDSTDEKQWRKGVLVIAENIHNITLRPGEVGDQMINKCKVYNPKCKSTLKRNLLMKRLLELSGDEKIPDEIILEFKRQDVESIAEIVLKKVSFDIHDKPDDKYYPAPLMTKTQRILLGLMVRLEQENVEKVMDTFLSKAEAFLFKLGCGLRTLIPITRLYMAVCKLRRDIDKMRNFCNAAFLSMGDLAVPLFFTVLTSWIEVLPLESDIKSYPLAKILVQIIHLKNCNKPGHNLFPLKLLLNQFYGYPKERWNCDEIFEEVFQQYLKNPDKSSDMAIRLLCKNKDTKWVYKKVNEFFKPLIYKIPLENVNFKATVIILIGNICNIRPQSEFDESSLNELRRWLTGLTEDENVHDLIIKSVDLSLQKLSKKKLKAKIKIKKKKIPNRPKNNRKLKKYKKKTVD